MSFRCGNCNVAVKPVPEGTRPIRKVTKIREKNYLGGGQGWEIAQEKLLCKPCGERQGPLEKVFA